MPLTNEQARQLIDATQAHDAYRFARREFREQFRYAARWREIGARRYLYIGDVSQGPATPATEARYASYTERREALVTRMDRLTARLSEMAPVTKALRLGRVPTLAARILRALDDEGVFGKGVVVIGTHALFAYEAAAGEFFQAELLATTDLDLGWDAKKRLEIVAEDGRCSTVLSILRRVDRSFETSRSSGIYASNDEGFIVELITPVEEVPRAATGIAHDLAANPIPEIAPLVAGLPYSATAIGHDGLPVRVICPQPEPFIAHKRFIAFHSGRPPAQRRRDAAQADAVEALLPILAPTREHFREL
jgi:hypothetical protein